MRGSWRVIYQDGTELSQWDAQHPLAVANEVPLRAIRWPEVATVVFESQWAGRAEFGFAGVPEGAQVKLRQRTMRSVGGSISMVCTERAGAPDPPAPEDTLSIFYWVPDGSYHSCDRHHCDELAQYVLHQLWGRPHGALAPNHTHLQLAPDAIIQVA
jgi:hypothetical protein